jgi:hypothetical protein
MPWEIGGRPVARLVIAVTVVDGKTDVSGTHVPRSANPFTAGTTFSRRNLSRAR